MNQLQYISLILLALYFVGIMFVVLRAKASTTSEEYFLAGRTTTFLGLVYNIYSFLVGWWICHRFVDHGFNQGVSSFWIYGMPVLFSTFLMYLFSKAIRNNRNHYSTTINGGSLQQKSCFFIILTYFNFHDFRGCNSSSCYW